MTSENNRSIEEELAFLYDDNDDIRRLIRAAGLNPAAFNLQGKPINIWFEVKAEAEKRGSWRDIIEIASKDYPNRPVLKNALEQQSNKVTPSAATPSLATKEQFGNSPVNQSTLSSSPQVTKNEFDNVETLFTWLHLSDIHFGHGDPSHQANQTMVLAALNKDLKEAQNKGLKLSAIFVTGDIAFKADKAEYARATEFLSKVSTILGVNKEKIYIVPGNHDIQRNVAKGDNFVMEWLNALRGDWRKLDTALSQVANGRESARLVERMQNYLEFAKNFAPYNKKNTSADTAWLHPTGLFWKEKIPLAHNISLRLIGLNSALLCQDDADEGKLAIGNIQLSDTLQDFANEIGLILSHHPLDWFQPGHGKDVEGWLKNNVDIHLSGHVHKGESRSTFESYGGRLINIVAGAVHQDAQKGNKQLIHEYSWSHLKLTKEGKIELETWPRRFTEDTHDFRQNSSLSLRDKLYSSFILQTKHIEQPINSIVPQNTTNHNSDVLPEPKSVDIPAKITVEPSQILPIGPETPNPDPKEQVHGVLNEAKRLLHEEHYVEAKEQYKKYLKLNPQDAIAHYNLGYAYNSLGEHLEAIKSYDSAIKLEDSFFEAYYNRGVSYFKKEKFKTTLEDCNKIIEKLHRDDADTYFLRGCSYILLARYIEAINDFDKVLALRPGYGAASERRNRALALLNRTT